MIKIDNSLKITMFTGDSGHFTLTVSENGVPVVLATGDTVRFSVKEKTTDVTYALQKEITTFTEAGAAVVTLLPADTASLTPNVVDNVINTDFPYYFYDLEWTDANGEVHTIMKDFKLGKLVLVAGVTSE